MSNVIQHVLLILGADEKDKTKAKKGDKTLRCLHFYLTSFIVLIEFVLLQSQQQKKRKPKVMQWIRKVNEMRPNKLITLI